MNTYVYIDGFNLYYGALKGTRYKWLDLKALMSRVLPSSHNIIKIKYFTARVSGAADPDAPRRQAIYLKAIKTLPEIEIHFGSFLSKTMWRPIINLPIANRNLHLSTPIKIQRGDYAVDGSIPQMLPIGDYPLKGVRLRGPHVKPLSNAVIAHVHTMEEKGSDVNLATHLINDAWKNIFAAAVVVSNDTDLVEPIRMVAMERRKNVTVVCPGRWAVAPKLERVATNTRHIRSSMLQVSQFPDPIPGAMIRKPPTW